MNEIAVIVVSIRKGRISDVQVPIGLDVNVEVRDYDLKNQTGKILKDENEERYNLFTYRFIKPTRK